MSSISIQEHNRKAGMLLDSLKTFFSFDEKKKLPGLRIGSITSKGFVIPMIEFNENKFAAKLLSRLKHFGFPVPSIEKTCAKFGNINSVRILSCPNNPKYEVVPEDASSIFSVLTKWAKEKGHKQRIVAGPDFIRLQSVEFATMALAFLKNQLRQDFSFERNYEDIFFSSKKPKKVILEKSKEEPRKDFLCKVITQIFEVSITLDDEDRGNIIFGFQTPEALQNVKEYFELCDMPCHIHGETLVFPETTKLVAWDDIVKLFEAGETTTNKAPHVLSAVEQGTTISSENFYAEVRSYVQTEGYKKFTDSSMARVSLYTYRMGLDDTKSNLDLLIPKALIDKPHWSIKRKSKGGRWFEFSLKDAPQTATEASVSGKVLSNILLNRIEALRSSASESEVLSRNDITKGLKLIQDIGAKFGLKFERTISSKFLMEKYPNGRYLHWKNKLEKIQEAIPRFIELGYQAKLSRSSILFLHVYPQKGNGAITPVSLPSKTVIAPGALPGTDVLKINVQVEIELQPAQVIRVVQSVPDQQLLEEIQRRGTAFSKKVLGVVQSLL